ncbi:hypothetical protein JW859_07175 [bacterium]|nr:hypothetical protein [bacterium]
MNDIDPVPDGDEPGVDQSLWIKAPQHILRVEAAITRLLNGRQSFWAWWKALNTGLALDAAQDQIFLNSLRWRLVVYNLISITTLLGTLFLTAAACVDQPAIAWFGCFPILFYAAVSALGLYLGWIYQHRLAGLRETSADGLARENVLSIIAGNDERLTLLHEHMPGWLRLLTGKPRNIEQATQLVARNLDWYLAPPGPIKVLDFLINSRTLFIVGFALFLPAVLPLNAIAHAESLPFFFLALSAALIFLSLNDIADFRQRVQAEEMLRYIAAIKLAGAVD